MSPNAGYLLVNEILPRLRSSIPNAVRCVGAEDHQELLQDGTAIAAKMLDSAEANGKEFSAGNIAYYAVQHLKSGRRSTGYFKSDPLHPGAQLSGRARMCSMDEPIHAGDESGEESFTLGDVLASRADDPAMEACRRMDWEGLSEKLDAVAEAILKALVQGMDLTQLVSVMGLSRSTLQCHKNRLARLIRGILGDDILALAQERPCWIDGVHAAREHASCRWDRRAA